MVAEEGGRVVGVATAGLVPLAARLRRAAAGVREPLARHAGEVARDPEALLLDLDLGVVAEEARGRGLYGRLLADRLAWGAGRGAVLAMSMGWRAPDGCHIEGSMARAGFTRLATVEEFFLAASEATGSGCPFCGSPCRCPADLFVRWIGPTRSAAGQAPRAR
jgi:GNAT superfamily N-acetyltransferase